MRSNYPHSASYDDSEKNLFVQRTLLTGIHHSSVNELDALFGELKSGIIVADESFKVRYFNSAVKQLGIDENLLLVGSLGIVDLLPHLLQESKLIKCYEKIMTRQEIFFDEGFVMPRIEKLFVTSSPGGGIIIKILVKELHMDSAANLMQYFPDLPFAYCGFRLGHPKRMQIEFYSDNFSQMFNTSDKEEFSLTSFEHLVFDEDLSMLLKVIGNLKKSKNQYQSFNIRLLNNNRSSWKWFKMHISKYREISFDQLCIAYLQDIHDEVLKDQSHNELVSEILDEERERMAMELHDGLGQQLVALNLNLDFIKESSEDRAILDKCSNMVKESLIQMKSLCYNLAPPEFDRGLLHSVDKLFGRLQEFSSTINYEFQAKKIPIRELSAQQAYNVLRIIQEFVSNSQKYSNCTTIRCEIGRKNDKIAVLISDDGKGFDMKNAKLGFGLRNIEKRAKLANAEVEFNSAIGEGTFLYLLF